MNWSRANLKEETKLITKGTTPTTLGMVFSDSGVPFLRAQNLIDGAVSVEADPLYISEETHRSLKRSSIQDGDLLISIAGTIGRASLVPDGSPAMNCNQAVAIIRLGEKLDRRFVLHWLSSDDAIRQMARGKVTGVISNLSLGEIGSLKIPLPPLPEQKRIAGILDQADALRRLRARALEKLNTLGQAIFHEMFGGGPHTIALDDICLPIERIDPAKHPSEVGFIYIDIAAVDQQSKAINAAQIVPSDDAPSRARQVVQEGDVLVSTVRPNLNSVAVVEATQGLTIASTGFCVLRPDPEKTSSAFLFEVVKSANFIADMISQATGASYPAVSDRIVKAHKVPQLSEQDRRNFTNRLDIVRMQQPRAASALAKAESLFTALQHRAFRGEL